MASKKDLTKYLVDLTKEELEKEVEKLYVKFKEVKTYYDIELSGDTSSIVNEIKEKIKKEYNLDKGYAKGRAAVVKKIIDDFAKISVFPIDLIDIILYRVEWSMKFIKGKLEDWDYEMVTQATYTSVENAFERALKLIDKHQFHSDFQPRCNEILAYTGKLDWGFSSNMNYLYNNYYLKQGSE